MIFQCCRCGKKIDNQEDDYEALEVENDVGRVWFHYHVLCLDDMRTIERRFKELGTPEKSPIPKNIRGIKGSWTPPTVHHHHE